VIVGYNAGVGIMTAAADGTVAVGASALGALTSGAANTAVGYQSGQFTTTGLNNTFVGYAAGQGITGAKLTNNSNTAIGMNAGLLLQGAADGNTIIGGSAGDVITTGTLNTIVGKGTDPSSATGTNQTVIGGGTTGVADNSVTLGNASVTAVYAASDGDAVVYCGGINMSLNQPAADAGSMTSEHLDHYEEGTWTPVVADHATAGNTGGFAGYSPGGTYTKIGRMVHVNCMLNQITTTGMTGAEILHIRGLPFTVDGHSFGSLYTYRVTRHADTVSSNATAPDNGVYCIFPYYVASSGTVDARTIVSDIVSNTSTVAFTLSYSV
jgi:hypothetical protein